MDFSKDGQLSGLEMMEVESRAAAFNPPSMTGTRVKNLFCNFDDEPEGNSGSEYWKYWIV